MAILKKEYELSVWDETLGEKGQKEEIKRAIIGAHDMNYDGRATALKLSRKINGTNVLTFQMPSKYFNSELGEYIHNEFCDYIFNERKLKLKYDGEWFEFYVKNISENKQFKSIMYQYQCEDAFIDELSRNGYGITFDTELYNNVEEIGVFTEQILEDSIWEYDASKNWGDFTEYAEEKLFKIPVSMFNKIEGYKLNYQVDGELTNPFSGEKRNLELGDDLSREKKMFWDNGQFDNGIPLLDKKTTVVNDGYIYVPYSCLNFCYVSSDKDGEGFAATQEAVVGTIGNTKSYYLTPDSIDPTFLIQFIAIPSGAEVLIDEAELLVNKDYSYVMTLADWNKNVNTNIYYDSEKKVMENSIVANKVVCYDGYLDKINDASLTFGKKISITDRTEINISEDIDQYVTVYNNSEDEYSSMFTSDEWIDSEDKYRICSYEATRMIVPQLARNLIQNGTEMTDTSGWDVMKTYTGVNSVSASISVKVETSSDSDTTNNLQINETQGLILNGCAAAGEGEQVEDSEKGLYSSFINFGVVGQEETISKEQTYVFRFSGEYLNKKENDGQITYEPANIRSNVAIYIGEGSYDADGDYNVSKLINLPVESGKNYFIRPTVNIKNPYFVIEIKQTTSPIVYNLKEAIFAKAFTKGVDFFNKEEQGFYKYTGRDIFFSPNSWAKNTNYYYRECDTNEFLAETDVVEGDAYAYKKYFRQQVQAGGAARDTFTLKSYLNNDVEKNGYDPTEYTEEDLKIITDYIDLNQCNYYNSAATASEKDCGHECSTNGLCMYQKYGYCPYLFQTQKHCRKIRTLNGEKSNRFNLTQELSKVFEIYPVYYIEHKENGKIVVDTIEEDGKKYEKMRKKVFYITEKGVENKLGFRYEKNLSNISRTFDSKEIVTKLYVEDVDSELSKTGLCSIKTAEDNPSKDSYIIDFSYYIMRGLLDKDSTNADLYGKDDSDIGYLKTLGYYNGEYDRLSNLIINLQDESYTELQANIEVNLTSIETAQQELNKIKKNMSKYSAAKKTTKTEGQDELQTLEESDTYKNYKVKYTEQKNVLLGLIEDTFMTNGIYDFSLPIKNWGGASNTEELLNKISTYGFKKFKEDYLDTFKYKNYGMMGQFTAEYLQIQDWKKQRAKYLKDINRISLEFYQKYEPYLKEGTWSDSNYLSDNSYYFGAKEVAKQGAIPKLTYNISVVDLSILDGDYKVGIADTTYIEDIETFGVNKETGFPNKLKVIISGITYDLDIPTQNSIEIQNYTTQFEDLFQQVSASVQSLSFNENIYKRSSNFTSTQNITGESLQGGLTDNQLTLLETDEKNISLDHNGQSGSDINNHANKYKLTGEGLFFSNNGGQTWNVGVTPKGINADYINVGSLDASKISIVDGSYLYFLWDKGGITAYREPQATKEGGQYFQDFARFNKYGLSLVEDGKIKLRAGYEYKQNSVFLEEDKGKISLETDISSDHKLGFYLYNNTGETIFFTESGEDKDSSAKLSLRGEIYVTNTNLQYTNATPSKINYSHLYNFSDSSIKEYSEASKILPETNLVFDYDKFILDWKKEYHSPAIEYLESYVLGILINNKILENLKNDEVEIQLTLNTQKTITLQEKYYLSETKNAYIPFSKYSLVDYKIIVGDEELNGIYYYLFSDLEKNQAWDATIYNDKKIKKIIKEDKNAKENNSKNPINIQNVTFWELDENTSQLNKNILQLYKITTTIYYKNMEHYNEEIIEKSDGTTALYINNPSLENNSEHRLFCCATKKEIEGELTNLNIFTILKNGKLFIGGEILKTENEPIEHLSKMPSEIFVKNAGIEITSEGKLFINFNNLATKNDQGEELTLVDYVTGEIQKQGSVLTIHSHKISSLNCIYSQKNGTEHRIGIPVIGIEGSFFTSAADEPVKWRDLKALFNSGYVSGSENSSSVKAAFNCYIEGEEMNTTDSRTGLRIDCSESNTESAGTQMTGAYGSSYSLPDTIDGGE